MNKDHYQRVVSQKEKRRSDLSSPWSRLLCADLFAALAQTCEENPSLLDGQEAADPSIKLNELRGLKTLQKDFVETTCASSMLVSPLLRVSFYS